MINSRCKCISQTIVKDLLCSVNRLNLISLLKSIIYMAGITGGSLAEIPPSRLFSPRPSKNGTVVARNSYRMREEITLEKTGCIYMNILKK
jgi:hypothetical protein